MESLGRVLIADDDDAIRHLVSKVLDLARIPHDAARDGRGAIELLQQHDYAVLLVDLMMPIVNGYELLEYLADHPRRPRTVIVMTAAADADLRRLDGSVVTTVIRKPFDIHELSMLIRDAALRVGAAAEPEAEQEGSNVLPFSS